jgi:hypothetical protein
MREWATENAEIQNDEKVFKLNEVLRDWKNKILDTIWIPKENKIENMK